MIYTCSKCGWSGEVKTRPRCLPCYAIAVKAWRARNVDKAKAQRARYDKKFRSERPEEYRAKRRRYYLPTTAKKARLRRIEWLRQGTVTRQDLQDVYRLYRGCCVYCGVSVKPRYTPTDPRGFDHVKSRITGGKHEKANVVVCCRKCNELKR